MDKIEIRLVKPEGEAGWCDFCIDGPTSLEPFCRDITHEEVAKYSEAYAQLLLSYGYHEQAYWATKMDRPTVLMELQRVAKGAGELIPYRQTSDWSVCRKCWRNWRIFKKRFPVDE